MLYGLGYWEVPLLRVSNLLLLAIIGSGAEDFAPVITYEAAAGAVAKIGEIGQ